MIGEENIKEQKEVAKFTKDNSYNEQNNGFENDSDFKIGSGLSFSRSTGKVATDQIKSSKIRFEPTAGPSGSAMEVPVEHNVEKAMKVLKRRLIKEGLFKLIKQRRFYEKPSEVKKRKKKEALKKIKKDEHKRNKATLV